MPLTGNFAEIYISILILNAVNRRERRTLERCPYESYRSGDISCSIVVYRGLSPPGHSQITGNNGNYLGTLEFLPKFDLFVADHIARYAK